MRGIDRFKAFLDCMSGGAWPFLVRGVICLVNSDNEQDLRLLNSSLCSRIRCPGFFQLAPPFP